MNQTGSSRIWSDEDDDDSIGKREKWEHGWSEMVRDAIHETSTVIDGLKPYTMYEVSVAAGTDMGYGPGSEPERRQTDEDGWYCDVFA